MKKSFLLSSLFALAIFVVPGFAQQPAPQRVAPLVRIPEGVQAHRDLAYVADGDESHKLDLYMPEKVDGLLPLIIWVHGGGWQNGNKAGCPPLRDGYVGLGYAVVSLNYRLSNQATFPAQIEDCKAAIRWLRAHAREYNLDPNRFGAWGSSAGGHLVALLGTSGEAKAFDVGADLDQSSRVQAVCDYYGPTDFTATPTTPAANSAESKLLGGPIMEHQDKAKRANPITFVSRENPPFLILHGDKDGTVPVNQSQLLFDALKQAGVSVHFHTIKGAGHGRGFGGPEIGPMVAAFFDKYLKSKSPPSNLGPATTSESDASAEKPSPPRKNS